MDYLGRLEVISRVFRGDSEESQSQKLFRQRHRSEAHFAGRATHQHT